MSSEQKIMCGVCWHEKPGHYPNCPVLTGAPQRGQQGLNQQDLQIPQQLQGEGLMQGPVYPGYGPYGQSDTDTRILAELAMIRADQRRILEILAGAQKGSPNDQLPR